MFDFGKIKKALTGIRAQHDTLLDQKDKLLVRLENLQSLPLPKSDLTEHLYSSIDAGATEYKRRLSKQLDNIHEQARPLRLTPFFPVLAPWTQGGPGLLPEAILCLFANPIKDAISKIVEDMTWPEAGPPLKARQIEMQKIDEQIVKIETELTSLRSIAKESGIILSSSLTDDIL